MNNSPIETVISNLCDVDKTIQWTGGGSVWIGKKSSVTVPYDVWTAADRKQRESLMAACQQKAVKLTLRVLQADGNVVEIAYDPSVLMKPRTVGAPKAATNKFLQDMQDDDKMHTINATSGAGVAAANHYGATKTQEDTGVGAHAEGANLNGFQKDADTDVTSTKQALEEQNADDTKQDEAPEQAPMDIVRDKFNSLVSDKQWEPALKLLVDSFGKEKVTFTTRTLMSLKNFDAVVAKYNLM